MSTPRMTAADAVLLVVDVQDKLLAKIHRAGELIHSLAFLMDVANTLGVPVRATEQYPKGLGTTTAEIARRLPTPPLPKTAFSCCGAEGFTADLRTLNRPNVVIVGMEAHVCVAQTALDLLDAGFRVFLPVDAVGSRESGDKAIALRWLDKAGVVLTSAEATVFEWVRDAAHPRFKAVSRLVIDRPRG